jgi:hypothetical protein
VMYIGCCQNENYEMYNMIISNLRAGHGTI